MALQKTVNKEQALGQPGQFYDASLRRVTAYKLDNVDSKKESIGRVFTFDADGQPQLGGTGKFAGILCHPQAYARLGLEPSLAVAQGSAGELADLGRLVVLSSATAKPADKVQYDTTTGEIAGAAPEEAAAGMALLPGAVFFMYSAEADGLAVIQLGATE
ncbi:hypothetical protein LJC36_00210 [Desulfovibrio sp. OttesenSCG-928-C14]|nr:hypothetical protein [Desulfovibrio sp. OttesenSCG-928-C14]